MYCMRCGAKMLDGAKFCTNCGEPAFSEATMGNTSDDRSHKQGQIPSDTLMEQRIIGDSVPKNASGHNKTIEGQIQNETPEIAVDDRRGEKLAHEMDSSLQSPVPGVIIQDNQEDKEATPDEYGEQDVNRKDNPPHENRKRNWVLIGSLIAVVVICIAIVGLILSGAFSDPEKQKDELFDKLSSYNYWSNQDESDIIRFYIDSNAKSAPQRISVQMRNPDGTIDTIFGAFSNGVYERNRKDAEDVVTITEFQSSNDLITQLRVEYTEDAGDQYLFFYINGDTSIGGMFHPQFGPMPTLESTVQSGVSSQDDESKLGGNEDSSYEDNVDDEPIYSDTVDTNNDCVKLYESILDKAFENTTFTQESKEFLSNNLEWFPYADAPSLSNGNYNEAWDAIEQWADMEWRWSGEYSRDLYNNISQYYSHPLYIHGFFSSFATKEVWTNTIGDRQYKQTIYFVYTMDNDILYAFVYNGDEELFLEMGLTGVAGMDYVGVPLSTGTYTDGNGTTMDCIIFAASVICAT